MNARTTAWPGPILIKWSAIAGSVALAGVLALVFHERWLPKAAQFVAQVAGQKNERNAGPETPASNSVGHNEATSLVLTPQAKRNVGLKTAAIKLGTFVRTEAMPAIVVARAGRSEIQVTAPLGGRVTRVYSVKGATVQPGQPLFDLRLTHEELVQAQSEFLMTAEELDVVAREIKRLKSVSVPGAIPGKTVRQREYEQQRLNAVFNARQQSLLLHGLTQEQVSGIVASRKLVQGLTVVAPRNTESGDPMTMAHPYTVRSLQAKPGQYVNAGAALCELIDYRDLYIEGRAFEQDADELLRATREGWTITASRVDKRQRSDILKGLKIIFVDNEIGLESRSLHFYVGLPNQSVHESTSGGHRFTTWRYKLGQRMQLHVPLQMWSDRIVLPLDAVAKEGVEHYVFVQNGDHFDRVAVQVEYQDQFAMVLANDGSVFVGDIVATNGAHQLQMALKNKSGGAPDPHAGHNH